MRGDEAMKPEEYDVVQLRKPLPQHNLPVGARGTVVMDYGKYAEPGKKDLAIAYEVEFMDAGGDTLAVDTIAESDLEVVWREGAGWLPGFAPDAQP
jgi:hypothetical protein